VKQQGVTWRWLAAGLVLAVSMQAQTVPVAQGPLTVAAIFAEHGGPVGEAPKDFVWSADGRTVSYVSADNEHGEPGDIIGIDTATGAATVLADGSRIATLSEMAEGQDAGKAIRDRDHRARYDEASYQWTPDGKHLLLEAGGALWLHDIQSGADVRMGATGLGSGGDPKYAPDGTRLSFVSGSNLHVETVADGRELALTASRSAAVLNGAVDWLYEEELDTRSNAFWSPDSQHIVYLQTDETEVARYPLTDWMGRHAGVEMQRYPQPGDANPAVRVGVVNAAGGATVWMKIPLAENQDYIPRLGWVDAHTVWVEVLRRDQRRRSIYFADAATGRARRMLTETDRRFLDEDYDVELLSGGRLLWTSWRDGHMHLYLYRFNAEHPLLGRARLERQLTRGLWDVLSVCAVDAGRGVVEYTSNESDPREEMLWQVRLDGTGKTLLSTVHGVHDVHFNAQGNRYVDTVSSRMEPPVVSVCVVGGACHVFWKAHALPPAVKLVRPEWVVSHAADGTVLYGELLLPPGRTARASVPLILNPYGGPHVQMVREKWEKNALFDQLLVERGFAVLRVDNRGMGHRGRSFAQAAYRDFGPVQLQDQLHVLDAVLAEDPQLDPQRLAWWGWSWGGTFTLYAMTHSTRFAVGAAVAPVTDWRLYDSAYTERYMSQPDEDAQNYADDAVVNSASRLHGHLLVAHGTGDDNVHVSNTMQWLDALMAADKTCDLLLYPRLTHSLDTPEARTQLYGKILEEFEQSLHPER
jgi:dipeptidyl-peptidase-4